METLLSLSGLLGAACCVGMYAAVSMAKVSAQKPIFFVVNGVGAVLVLIGASRQFDIGDAGTIAQELIWAVISFAGGVRAWLQDGGAARAKAWTRRVRLIVAARRTAA